ncbi:MAG: FkbM family methyltransferase [Candidatus Solibacter usitatus]|nr:FkbM family methyltransferase [Candidatus Solibacter usitatus]
MAPFGDLLDSYTRQSRVLARDEALGLVKVHSGLRDFWAPEAGDAIGGSALVPYLLAEHELMLENNPSLQVRPGDIVIDIGGHVGTYTHLALHRGAAKVVVMEINPLNLECLRRNFAGEIAAGKVVICPRGAWSSETSTKFNFSRVNSGMGSVVFDQNSDGQIEVPLVRIDTLMAELALPKVDFMKLDIEGAEREALAGARQTLARFKPRLSIDAYHRPDDQVVLPKVILGANPRYVTTCGPCELVGRRFQPHVLYYH